MNIASQQSSKDFDQFLHDCETLLETAIAKEFDKQESFVIMLAARHLDTVARNTVKTFEMDICLNCGDKVAEARLHDTRECIRCIAAIIARMEANILVCDINLN